MARDRYKAFSEEETGETKTKSKRVWKKYRKIISEEDKQRKKEYMKDQRKNDSSNVLKKIKRR